MRIVHCFLCLALLCLLPTIAIAQESVDTSKLVKVVPKSTNSKQTTRSIRLVLMGLVLSDSNRKPIDLVTIVLLDERTKKKQEMETGKDGVFQFRLLPETNYQIGVAYEGTTLGTKRISTVDKTEPEIFHVVFELSELVIDELLHPLLANSDRTAKLKSDSTVNYWEVLGPQISHNGCTSKSAYSNPYNNSHLTFKIQIDAFKRSKQTKNFFSKVEGKVKKERAANGFNRYVIGNFRNYKDAELHQKELFQKGYNKSFVAAYLNGYRLEMPVEEVLDMYYGKR